VCQNIIITFKLSGEFVAALGLKEIIYTSPLTSVDLNFIHYGRLTEQLPRDPKSPVFIQKTDFFRQVIDYYSRNQKAFTALHPTERVFLRHNIKQWNSLIKDHNQNINSSCWMRLLKRIGKVHEQALLPVELLYETSPWKSNGTPLDRWLSKHSENYISHAINSHNAQEVLSRGRIRPAFEQWKADKTVYREKGPGYYDKQEVSPDVRIQEIFGQEEERLRKLWKECLEGIVLDKKHIPEHKKLLPFVNAVYQIATSKNLDYIQLLNRVIYECDQRDPLDIRLQQVWQKCLEHANTLSKKDRTPYLDSCQNELNDIRFIITKELQLCCTIRAVRTGIAWNYGEVVVLRGKPDKLIANRVDAAVANEVGLFPPWLNGGKSFNLELADKDTIILGPRAILKYYKRRYRVAYLEDLTPAQKEFFKFLKN
jgi:hypothetical protein